MSAPPVRPHPPSRDRGPGLARRRRRGVLPHPRRRGVPRIDYDVVEFPHALTASQLDAAQEEVYGYGYEHALETARERLREDGELPAASAARHHLADHHPDLFADTVRCLFRVGRDVARAVAESVRLGYALDEPLSRAMHASVAGGTAAEDPQ